LDMPKLEEAKPYSAEKDKAADDRFITPAFHANPRPQSERKMVRTSTLDVVVRKPGEAAEEIRRLAERLGGFLVSSQISGGPHATSGSLTIRVPAERFEEARTEIRKLSLRIDAER